MTLIGVRRWRVEIYMCQQGCHYIVTVEPVVYVGKAEFKNFAAAFRRLFMNLERRWRWIRIFADKKEAEAFAADLTKFLGEPAYVYNGRTFLVAPQGEVLNHE